MDNIALLKRIVEESTVDHRKCAELLVLIDQTDYYITHKAANDLYAANVERQMHDKKVV